MTDNTMSGSYIWNFKSLGGNALYVSFPKRGTLPPLLACARDDTVQQRSVCSDSTRYDDHLRTGSKLALDISA